MASLAPATVDAARPTVSGVGGPNRRLDIQGLRALAVLIVVAFHAGLPMPGGFVGVDVFFVISGFVITAMLMREWSSTGRIRLGRFYVRRFKRLTPALALTVAVVMLASLLLLSPLGGGQQTAAKTAIGAMLLAANVVIARTTGDYFDSPAESNPLLNMWSLSVEEQFYLVFPAVLLIGWILGRRTRRPELAPVIVVGLVGVISFAFALAGSIGITIPLIPEALVGFYGPATRAWEFAVGALLALGGAKLAISSRFALPVMVTGAAMLAASLWLITGATPFPGVWTLLPVVGTLLLIAAGSSDTVVTRALASEQMVAIGDRSYSIYLWHWPFIVFAHLLWPGSSLVLLAAAALSFIPAYASYRWVEQPIRALPVTRGVPLARLVAVTVIPPIALAGALGLAARSGFWDTTIKDYQVAIQRSHAGEVAECTDEAWTKPNECTWNSDAPGRPVYLVGDSHADHFSEALISATKSVSRPLVSLSENGCAYLPCSLRWSDQGPEWDANCALYPKQTESYLQSATPGLVVIANSYWWFRDDSGVAVGRPGEAPTHEIPGRLDALAFGLTEAVRALQDAGHTVLLVQAVPQWTGEDSLNWATCSVIDMTTTGCSQTMSLSGARARQSRAADVVNNVARPGERSSRG